MKPILYEATETAFVSNGLGRLSDVITCNVVEERNGMYELAMTYPIDGIHFADIQEGRIVLAKPFEGGLPQPFIIYRIERPLNGICTIKAEHISYRLNNIVCMPFTAGSLAEVMTDISTYSSSTNPFNFTTDISSTVDYTLSEPREVRSILGGSSGSILDVYGQGDYEFDRFDVKLHADRGSDNGVVLRYGKNIIDLKNVTDLTGVYTGIVPYWTDGEGSTVTLPEKIVLSSHASDFPYYIIKTVDFSGDYEEAPTESQLRDKAQSYVANNEGWHIKNNITVSFVDLWNTEEYKNIANLERVRMCDIVHVKYGKLGVDFSTKVIKTDYNVIDERYNSITLGDTYYSLSNIINDEIAASEEKTTTHMQKAIEHATKLIQGGLGGHVVFTVNADGEPQEILIMDTDDITTAVNVLRINLNGIGFSHDGYNGTYSTAWTIDGHFVADFIDTGTLTADVIKAGVLSDEDGHTTFNLATGALKSDNLTIDSTYFKLASDGKITSINADGHKIEIEKGVITGYKADGETVSAQLEVGEGYFNIIGKLALNGVVGVSGSTSFVKSLTTEEYVLATISDVWTPAEINSATASSSSVTGTISIPVQSITLSGTCTVGGQTGTCSVSGNVPQQSVYINSGLTAAAQTITLNRAGSGSFTSKITPSYGTGTQMKAIKTVSANTGSINSADGLIQSIT